MQNCAVFLFIIIVCDIQAWGQYTYRVELMPGLSVFKPSVARIKYYEAFEGRIGGIVTRRISNTLSLETGLTIGFRAKTYNYFKRSPNGVPINGYYGFGVIASDIFVDSTAARNHGYVGIPLRINLDFFKGKIRLQPGLIFRHWRISAFNRTDGVYSGMLDVLMNERELCYTLGAGVKLPYTVFLGVEAFYGIKPLAFSAVGALHANANDNPEGKLVPVFYRIRNAGLFVTTGMDIEQIFKGKKRKGEILCPVNHPVYKYKKKKKKSHLNPQTK